MIVGQLVAVVIIGYLLGSIPFGLLISRRKANVDLRQYGSGKTGATNVMRTMGSKAGVLVAALDVVKGVLAVVFAGMIFGESYMVVGDYTVGIFTGQAAAALAAMAGHLWPVFLKFRGGRGVATFLGGLIALCPVAGAFGSEVLIIGAGLSRFASLCSITGAVGAFAILIPLTILHGFPIEYLFYALIGALIIIFTHRGNIARLLNGTERRLGERVGTPSSPETRDLQGPQTETAG